MSVSGYNTVTGFFDESGKAGDRNVVVIGGVAAYNEHFAPFANDWGRLLYKNGIQVVSAKEAFRSHIPLSKKNPRVGFKERIEDLLPFINCIRNHLQVVIAVAINVRAFEKLPTHFFQTFGRDPEYVSFARSLLEVVGFTPDRDKVCFTCDDEEKLAVNFFRLYRKVKRVFPEARKKCVAISFADDKYLFALQAADIVCGLVRLEADRKMFRVRYDYTALYKRLTMLPASSEKLWNVLTSINGKQELMHLSDSLEKSRKEQLGAEDQRLRNI